jgi:hypothetical protein
MGTELGVKGFTVKPLFSDEFLTNSTGLLF